MTTTQVHSFLLAPDEGLHPLQQRIETETKIELLNQELLQETGVTLDPRKPAAQCVLDGVVSIFWPLECVLILQKNILVNLQQFISPFFFLIIREDGTATLYICLTRA